MIRFGDRYPVGDRMVPSIAMGAYDSGYLKLGSYALVNGTAPSLVFKRIFFLERPTRELSEVTGGHSEYSGLVHHGTYGLRPVVSFRNNKGDDSGEQDRRLVVWTGLGAGQYEEHINLPPCETIVGLQIGKVISKTGEFELLDDGTKVKAKNFPTVCYFDGPFGPDPLSANHWPEVGC